MARRRHGAAYMRYVRSFRKNRSHRRRHRRNPIPVGGVVVGANPRRRHYRRNPVMGRLKSVIPALQPVLYSGAGYVGAHALEYFLTVPGTNPDGTVSQPLIPTTITGSSIGKYAVRIGCVIGVTYLAKLALGADKAKMVGIGGGVYVLTSALKEFMPTSVSPYLAEYRRTAPRLAAYRPLAAANVTRGAFGQPMVSLSGTQNRFNRFAR